MDDAAFARSLADRVARVPGVTTVTLGGSRAQGTHRPDSDWDLGLYYRGGFDPDGVRALGWDGVVSDIGGWGGGVMNGGAWLTIDGQKVDLIYRDLDEVEHWWSLARDGRFEVQRLLGYIAGIPTYVVVGELALGRVLAGDPLPRPEFPDALRANAPRWWRDTAGFSVDYARGFARVGDSLGVAANLARAVIEIAHARLAARGEWTLNEKRMPERAGLADLIPRFGQLGSSEEELLAAVDEVGGGLRPYE